MKPYPIITTLLTLMALVGLFSLRIVGLYSHQALAVVLLLGLVWAIASRGWLAGKRRLHLELLREPGGRDHRPQLLQAIGRASFWAMTGTACAAVFPRSAEMTPLIAGVIGIAVLLVAASFLVPRRTNAGPTLVMAASALVLAFDLGRAFAGGGFRDGEADIVQLAPPFEGEWLVLQGGPSPLQNHHLSAYNQRFALDLVQLDNGRIFTDEAGNASIYSWEQPLISPVDGTVVMAEDRMEDAEGANFVTDPADAAGNVVVIELDTGHFVVLAHLRHGTLQVDEGDRVRKGDPLALVGNSGNTTMAHLHLQVQTHRDLWDPDNRSVPFVFEGDGRVLARNDRVVGASSLQRALAAFEDDEHGDLHSVVVIQNGVLVAERYYNGGDRQALVDVRSAGKSVTSLLFGIALDQGAIESLDDPVAKYWPETQGSAIGPVRLADVLTMRTGLDADGNDPESPGYEDNMDAADDPLAFAMSVPAAEEPGKRYRYNSLAAYVAGIVIGRATGQGLEDFARDNLFGPLGIERWDWQEDRAGYTKGQGNLFLTAPGLARIGQMVLNDGAYDGRQVVSSEWIGESLQPRFDISDSDPFASGYGYYWYRQTYPLNGRSIEVSFASGSGGNKIYVIPELDLVVSVMSRAYGQGHGQRRSEGILRAVLGARGAQSGDTERGARLSLRP